MHSANCSGQIRKKKINSYSIKHYIMSGGNALEKLNIKRTLNIQSQLTQKGLLTQLKSSILIHSDLESHQSQHEGVCVYV